MKANADLTNRHEIRVRFSEVDSMAVVWHGHYIKYFEDGREAFGRQYGINYMLVRKHGYTIPLVEINCKFKKIVSHDEIITVESRYIPSQATKIRFEYTIFNQQQEIAATGHSVQVFLDEELNLRLTDPEFFTDWKKKWNV